MENKPHSREKKVGSGSVDVGKGRKVNTGGPVGGSSQSGRPTGPQGGGDRGYNDQRGPSGKTAGALGLLALFAFIPKKLRPIVLVAVVVLLLFSFMNGGSESTAPVSTPSYTLPPQTAQPANASGALDDSGMMFSSADYGDWAQLFGSQLCGNGSS